MKDQISCICGVIALAVAPMALADTTWTLQPTGSVTIGTNTQTSTAWANTVGSGSGVDTYDVEQQLYNSNSNSTNFWLYTGGLGINNKDGCASASNSCDVGDQYSTAPEHAIDNEQRREMALLSFTEKVKLTSASIGWTGADADITVMAWTGNGAPPSFTNNTWAEVGTTVGWTTIGNYTSLAANSTTDQSVAIAAGNVTSSYWLVGAYNSLAASTNKNTSGVLMDSNADYVKLKAVTTTVPEPGILALLGFALVGGLCTAKRRRPI